MAPCAITVDASLPSTCLSDCDCKVSNFVSKTELFIEQKDYVTYTVLVHLLNISFCHESSPQLIL